MVCYTIPLVAAIVTTILWGSRRGGPAGWWLNLLLYGGALGGAIGHLWHGLFLIGAPFIDVFLGVTITAAIFGAWGITLGMVRAYPGLGRRMGYRLGILRASEKR